MLHVFRRAKVKEFEREGHLGGIPQTRLRLPLMTVHQADEEAAIEEDGALHPALQVKSVSCNGQDCTPGHQLQTYVSCTAHLESQP